MQQQEAAAFGRHTLFHGVLRAMFPPLGYLRYPEKHLLLVTACLGLLGALGAERVLASGDTRQLRHALTAAAGLLIAALFGALFQPGKLFSLADIRTITNHFTVIVLD